MQQFKRFFLFCAGVELSILEQCPSDTNKYIGIGATVFFTGILAFCSAAYALFTVFDSRIAALLFGLIWGMMIFNLDRYIVMSMKSRGAWWRDFMVALPRLALAVLLAIVISKPLELKIFEKEIQGELIKMQQELFKDQEERVSARFTEELQRNKIQIEDYKSEISEKTARRDALALEALKEADGTGGSQKRNMGPIYKAKKTAADKAALELAAIVAANRPKIQALEAQIAQTTNTQQTTIQNLERSSYDGMAARMEALSRLSSSSWAIRMASMFITLLFIAIETAPIFVKLISSRSPYDYVLHQHEHVFEMQHLREVTGKQVAIQNSVRYDTEVGTHEIHAKIKIEKAKIDAQLKQKLNALGDEPIVGY